MLEELGYVAMWQADKSVEADGRIENLIELTRAMEDYPSLTSFLEHVSLVMDNDASDTAEKLAVMTLHAAKGLEFDHVFLVGWEEGVFPSQRALDEGGGKALEEERRLAYVGVTRARRTATILHAANRQVYGQWTAAIPSRFIAELPAANIDVIEHDERRPEPVARGAIGCRPGGDPFGDVSRGTGRGPGWARAAAPGRVRPECRRQRRARPAGHARCARQRGLGRPQGPQRCCGRFTGVSHQIRQRHRDRDRRQQAGDRLRTCRQPSACSTASSKSPAR